MTEKMTRIKYSSRVGDTSSWLSSLVRMNHCDATWP